MRRYIQWNTQDPHSDFPFFMISLNDAAGRFKDVVVSSTDPIAARLRSDPVKSSLHEVLDLEVNEDYIGLPSFLGIYGISQRNLTAGEQ
jgi:hypothetical protein